MAIFKSLRFCLGEEGLDVFQGDPGIKSRAMVAGYGEGEEEVEVRTTWFPQWNGLPLEQSDMTIS